MTNSAKRPTAFSQYIATVDNGSDYGDAIIAYFRSGFSAATFASVSENILDELSSVAYSHRSTPIWAEDEFTDTVLASFITAIQDELAKRYEPAPAPAPAPTATTVTRQLHDFISRGIDGEHRIVGYRIIPQDDPNTFRIRYEWISGTFTAVTVDSRGRLID